MDPSSKGWDNHATYFDTPVAALFHEMSNCNTVYRFRCTHCNASATRALPTACVTAATDQ